MNCQLKRGVKPFDKAIYQSKHGSNRRVYASTSFGLYVLRCSSRRQHQFFLNQKVNLKNFLFNFVNNLTYQKEVGEYNFLFFKGDKINQDGSAIEQHKANGQGWMFEPYLSARIMSDLYLRGVALIIPSMLFLSMMIHLERPAVNTMQKL